MEHEFIKWLNSHHANVSAAQHVELGIGDDAAILNAGSETVILASDTIADGTHFLCEQDSLISIGRKALAVNLSDLAAMAARPIACLLNLQLPKSFDVEQAKQIFNGVESLAKEYGVTILGGDTNRWDGKLVVSVTAIGFQTQAQSNKNGWRLKGSQLGDCVLVSGSLGGSILGQHLHFEPRCKLALALADKYEIHGATDVSDSLSTDLMHMVCEGRGIAVFEDSIPVSEFAKKRAAESGESALSHALHDGEDFELIVSADPKTAEQIVNDRSLGVPMTIIGTVVDRTGLWSQSETNELIELVSKGYEH